jgi:hypothetical protein
LTAGTGFEGLDPQVVTEPATEQQQADALRFAKASVDHLRAQADIATEQAASLKAREKTVIAAHKAKTAEAAHIAKAAREELAAAEARLAELEG